MRTILKAETAIDYIRTPNPTTTCVTFDFQVSSNAFGAFFKDRDGAFSLTITQNGAYIVNEKSVTYINEPIELQIGQWYSAECGIKTDWVFNTYVLYVRIWQDKETTRTYMPKKQSKRRMLVAQKRLRRGKDALNRRSKQGSRWTYFEFLEHVEKNHQWALPHTRVCMRNHERMIREAQEPNHWSIWRS